MSEPYQQFKCTCGNNSFSISYQVRGRWNASLTFDEQRVKREGYGDDVRASSTPKTMRCESCGKRHPIPACANIV